MRSSFLSTMLSPQLIMFLLAIGYFTILGSQIVNGNCRAACLGWGGRPQFDFYRETIYDMAV